MRQKIWVIVVFLLLIGNTVQLHARQTDGSSLSAEERLLLDNLNDVRRRSNNVLLVPNAVLNQVARVYLNDLSSRPLNELGNIFFVRERSANGQIIESNLDTLLERFGFQPYSDGYVVDFIPIILNGITPDQFVNEVITDSRRPTRTIISRRMSLGLESTLPLLLPLYREIGIAYTRNASTGRFYYVIVVGSQPQVLPVMVTQRGTLNVIAQTAATRDVFLRIHNENARPFGDLINNERVIGAIVKMRISESLEAQPCPSPSESAPGWMDYRNIVELSLSEGSGLKTVSVQMCDNQGTTITSSTQVTYMDAVSGELVGALRIANMTQTAVVDAAQYATYQPTVEAILTATAAATTAP